MIHDFAITDGHVVFMDLPVVFDLELAMAGTMPYRWSDEYEARVGCHAARGRQRVRAVVHVEPCYVFHPLNAYETDGQVVVDTVRYDELWRRGAAEFPVARLHRWRLDQASGKVREQRLDDRAIEFPRCDERRTGLDHRYGYAVYTEGGADVNSGTALIKYDLRGGGAAVHEFGPGRVPGEGVFVPASATAGEDEGFILTYVYDAARDASDLVILDAASFAGPAVATITLPQRVPFGFHGSWIPDPV